MSYSNYKKRYNPYKNYKGNNVTSRAVKSIKECNNSNSTIDFAYKINYAFTAMYDSQTRSGVAALNLYKILLQSSNFQNMAKNWDQVKINGCQVRLNICDAVLSTADVNAIKSVNVVTGWDRTGLSLNEVKFYDDTDGEILRSDWDDTPAGQFRNIVGSNIAQGYGCKKGLVNSYQRFSRFESIYPKKLEEKACYVPTSTFEDYEDDNQFNVNSGMQSISNKYSNMSISNQISQSNPCIPFENNIKWKPTLLVGVFSTTIEREATKMLPNPDYVNWNLNHPTVGDARGYNISKGRVNTGYTVPAQIALEFGNKGYIKPISLIEWTDFINWSATIGIITQEQAQILLNLNAADTQVLANKISENTSGWVLQYNPYQPTKEDTSSGNTIGRVSQYGSVKPIVFNGEFTIAVSFNQQKGDV